MMHFQQSLWLSFTGILLLFLLTWESLLCVPHAPADMTVLGTSTRPQDTCVYSYIHGNSTIVIYGTFHVVLIVTLHVCWNTPRADRLYQPGYTHKYAQLSLSLSSFC